MLPPQGGSSRSLVLDVSQPFQLGRSIPPEWPQPFSGEQTSAGLNLIQIDVFGLMLQPLGKASRSSCPNYNGPQAAEWPLWLNNTWITGSKQALLLLLPAKKKKKKNWHKAGSYIQHFLYEDSCLILICNQFSFVISTPEWSVLLNVWAVHSSYLETKKKHNIWGWILRQCVHNNA